MFVLFSEKLIFENLDLTNENLYTFYLNNEEISNHYSLIFTLKELNSTNCVENFDLRDYFISDFYLRIYTSGCYYLDQNNYWQSNGLIVSFY